MNVTELVKRLGRKELAEACGVKRTSIAVWVYNSAIPEKHLATVSKVADERGIDLREFGFDVEGGE